MEAEEATATRRRHTPPWGAVVAVALVLLVAIVIVQLVAEPALREPLGVEEARSRVEFAVPRSLDSAAGAVTIVEGFKPHTGRWTNRAHVWARTTLARVTPSGPFHPPLERALVPLHFAGGVFWIEFMVRDQPWTSRAVLDTGSSNLVVGTDTCRGCDPSQGLIAVPESRHVRHQDITLHYGSQSVLADVTLSSIRVTGVALDEALTERILGGATSVARSLQAALREQGGPLSVVHMPTELLATKQISGDTSAHVFGLAPTPNGGGDGEDDPTSASVLRALFPATHGRGTFGVLLGRQAGAWLAGPVPPALAPHIAYVPIDRPPHLLHTPTLFYMARLVDVLVGPSTDRMRSLFSVTHGEPPPRAMWVMFDTGSSDTYASRSLRPPLLAARRAASPRLVVTLVLRNGLHLVLTPDTYVEHDAGGGDTLNLHAPFVDALLGVEGMLVGATAMRGWYLEHDLVQDRLGFAAVTAALGVDAA